jgi:beta-phosphoglucomutase
MLTTLILDFDGVIVESIPLKTVAFQKIFSFAPPEHLDEIIAFHLENGGMSRYDKFRHIYANILHEPLTPEQEERLADEYVRLIFDAMLTVPYVQGAEDLLRTAPGAPALHRLRDPGGRDARDRPPPGPHKVLRPDLRLAEDEGRVYQGDPRRDRRVAHPKALFVGDAPNDWQAACETGVRFVARVRPGDTNRFAGRPGVEEIVENLHELREYLRESVCSSRSHTP